MDLGFTFPRQVWESFSTLNRGFGCEYLTTNVTKMSLHKISLFKYLDDAVRVTITASTLTEVAVDQPQHIMIEGIHNKPEQPHLLHEPTRNDDIFFTQERTDEENTSALVLQDKETAEQNENDETIELVLCELSDHESDLEGVSASTVNTLPHIEQSHEEVVGVTETLEAISNAKQQCDDLSIQSPEAYSPEISIRICQNLTQSNDSGDSMDQSLNIEHEEGIAQNESEISITITKKCPLCNLTFQSLLHLTEHLNKHRFNAEGVEVIKELKKEIKEQCSICGNVYANSHCLLVHIEEMHTHHAPAECPECGIKVKNEKCLAGHMKRIHEQKERKYLCHLCPASFRVQNYLNGHLKTVHHGLPKDAFSCDKCNFKSASMKYIQRHQLQVHGDKRFNCHMCERKFSSSSNLKRHIDHVHPSTKLRRYECKHCSKSFSTKGNLNNHISKSHSLSIYTN